jgi:hypothetical protein
MNNREKKKYNAAAHNYVSDIRDNILPIGQCKCGNTLFMYLKSDENNISKYYCERTPTEENPACDPGDIRNPKDGDNFFFSLPEIAKVIIDNYGPESRHIFEI